MQRSAEQLRDDALQIWLAGVEAVHPDRLVPEFVHVAGNRLWAGDEEIRLDRVGRIAIAGGGKAAGAMAAALERVLGDDVLRAHDASGLVSVPMGSEPETSFVRVEAVRPVGANEPTHEAAIRAAEMLDLVFRLEPQDLCFCVLSGGGSALLPAPIDGFSLADKTALTRELSARGATIHEMNEVRSALSRIKGGGLARHCGAGWLIALVLSDVPGDDLSTIASGPTVLKPRSPRLAVEVLEKLGLDELDVGRRAIECLTSREESVQPMLNPDCSISNLLVGNNAAAVDAAGMEAERLGYSHAMTAAKEPEGLAEDIGAKLATMAWRMRNTGGPDCLITGGEPTVQLAPEALRGLGGRNQQLCLAALAGQADWSDMVLLSGGTDGEDGPTDAAGAWVDERVAQEAERRGLDVHDYLERNDAYSFFEQAGGLLKTGPTHTNVGDLRVITVSR
jgi:hydroxypyruvate reductase